MYTSNSEDSDSDSGTNFKRGKRKAKEESPAAKPVMKLDTGRSYHDDKPRHRDERYDDKHRHRDERARKSPPRKHHTNSSNRHSRDNRSRSREDLRKRRSKSSERHQKRSRSADKDRNRAPSPSHRRDSHRRKPEVYETSRHRDTHQKQNRISSPAAHSRNEPRNRHSPRDTHDVHIKKESRGSSKTSSGSRKHSSSNEASSYGPALPPQAVLKSEDADHYMPALPRNLKRQSPNPPNSKPKIGPTLPKNFQPMLAEAMETIDTIEAFDDATSDDDQMMIGPVLPGSSEMSERDLELEKRKIEMKLKQLDRRMEAVTNPDIKYREEWMLELPEIRKIPDMGLGTRQFRKNDRPDFSDRDQWTETPNGAKGPKRERHDTKKSDDDKRHELEMKRRDEEQEKMAKEHKKSHKRNKSLMEIHEKKLKKEKVRDLVAPKAIDFNNIFSITEKAKRGKTRATSVQPRHRPISQ